MRRVRIPSGSHQDPVFVITLATFSYWVACLLKHMLRHLIVLTPLQPSNLRCHQHGGYELEAHSSDIKANTTL